MELAYAITKVKKLRDGSKEASEEYEALTTILNNVGEIDEYVSKIKAVTSKYGDRNKVLEVALVQAVLHWVWDVDVY